MNELKALENECRILACSLYHHNWLEALTSKLDAEDFGSPETALIWRRIDFLSKTESEVTFAKLSSLMASNEAEHSFLIKLLGYAGSDYDLEGLILEIKEASRKRKLHTLLIQSSDYLKTASSEDVMQYLEKNIFALERLSSSDEIKTFKDVIDKPRPYSEILSQRVENHNSGITNFKGIPTGYYHFDSYFQGLSNGHLMVIGARPSVGKTTFATNLIEKMAISYGAIPYVLSLEMTKSELVEKIIAQQSRVNLRSIRDGNLLPIHLDKILKATELLATKNIIFDDQSGLTIEQIRTRLKWAVKHYSINIVFIDYLQLIVTTKRVEQRHLEIGDISRNLKEIAKELNVPVIALAQLNRKSEARDTKKPILSDLRESGSIEADADEVVLLHRPDLYDSTDRRGIMQVIVAKNRHGSVGEFELAFESETGHLSTYGR